MLLRSRNNMNQNYTTAHSYQNEKPLITEGVHAGGIGLSYSPYLTVLDKKKSEKSLYITRYRTGEIKVSTQNKYVANRNESRQKPPNNSGEREVEGLSGRGKKRLRRACSFFDTLHGGDPVGNAMITLTYGAISKSSHKESKKDLDRFIKSFKRHIRSKHKVKDVHYVWVAEIQPKRLKRTGEAVIHYHLVCPYYVDKGLISKWWNNAVNKPRIKANLPTQKLITDVKGGFHAGRYISSYLKKESHKIKGNGYNMSQATSQAIKPIFSECIHVEEGRVEEIYNDIEKASNTHTMYRYKDEEGVDRCLWLADSNDFLFEEVIKYSINKEHERI